MMGKTHWMCIDGWTQLSEPNSYHGGSWRLEHDGCTIEVFAIDQDINVGWDMPAFSWRISHPKLPSIVNLTAKNPHKQKNPLRAAREEALRMAGLVRNYLEKER